MDDMTKLVLRGVKATSNCIATIMEIICSEEVALEEADPWDAIERIRHEMLKSTSIIADLADKLESELQNNREADEGITQ